MSTRTIIEINHDYIHDLGDAEWEELKRVLRSGFAVRDIESGRHPVRGVRVLGQRHHSETLKLTVK